MAKEILLSLYMVKWIQISVGSQRLGGNMIIRAIIMIVSYYTINFAAWNLLINSKGFSPANALMMSYGILFFISLAVYGEHLLTEWKRLKKQWDVPLKFLSQLVVYCILVLTVTISIVFLVTQLFNIDPVPQYQNNIEYIIEEVTVLLSFLIIVILGPIIEEITFREASIGWVDDYNNQLMLYMGVASILFFNFLYMADPSEFFYYLPFSFLLTDYYFRKYRNIWASIALHSLIKLFYFILTYVGAF